jgi:phosphoglycerol transferase MdoB-like AlkP superfamily enzyme
VRDVRNHGFRQDWDMFEFLEKELSKNFSKTGSQPFVLHIANADTHPFPQYYTDPRCSDRVPDYPPILRSFDCLDQILERFLESFRKLSIANHTEIFIYGDHLVMPGAHKRTSLFEPRYMLALIPFTDQQVISKKTTVYDFAPTLLDLIEVDPFPNFPFGRSFFNPKPGLFPDFTHFKFIYDFFRESMNWNTSVKCVDGTNGFCART